MHNAKKASPEAESTAHEVLHHPVLQRRIISHLEKEEYQTLWLVEKAFIPAVAKWKYGTIGWRTYARLGESGCFNKVFLKAVRKIALTRQSTESMKWAGGVDTSAFTFDHPMLGRLQEKCPNLQSVRIDQSSSNHYDEVMDFWITEDFKWGYVTTVVDMDLAVEPEACRIAPPPKTWGDWNLTYSYHIRLRNVSGVGLQQDRPKRYLEWLLSSMDMRQIVGCRLEDIPCSLTDITLLRKRAEKKNGISSLMDIEAHMVEPFTLEEFEAFGALLPDNDRFANLQLLHWDEGHTTLRSPLISVSDLPSLVSIVRKKFRRLSALTIMIKGMNGDNFFLDEDLPLTSDPYPTDLEGPLNVTLIFEEEALGIHPEKLPLYALARNLAVMAGRATMYHLGVVDRAEKTWKRLDHESHMLHQIKFWLDLLSVEKRTHMRWVNFRMLDMPIPNISEMSMLTFTHNNRPIPRRTQRALDGLNQARERWAKTKELEDDIRGLVARNRKTTNKMVQVLLDSGEEFERPMSPFEGYQSGSKDIDEAVSNHPEVVKLQEDIAEFKRTRQLVDADMVASKRQRADDEAHQVVLGQRVDEINAQINGVKDELRVFGRYLT